MRYKNVRSQVRNQPWFLVWDQVRSQVQAQAWDQVRYQVRNRVLNFPNEI